MRAAFGLVLGAAWLAPAWFTPPVRRALAAGVGVEALAVFFAVHVSFDRYTREAPGRLMVAALLGILVALLIAGFWPGWEGLIALPQVVATYWEMQRADVRGRRYSVLVLRCTFIWLTLAGFAVFALPGVENGPYVPPPPTSIGDCESMACVFFREPARWLAAGMAYYFVAAAATLFWRPSTPRRWQGRRA